MRSNDISNTVLDFVIFEDIEQMDSYLAHIKPEVSDCYDPNPTITGKSVDFKVNLFDLLKEDESSFCLGMEHSVLENFEMNDREGYYLMYNLKHHNICAEIFIKLHFSCHGKEAPSFRLSEEDILNFNIPDEYNRSIDRLDAEIVIVWKMWGFYS